MRYHYAKPPSVSSCVGTKCAWDRTVHNLKNVYCGMFAVHAAPCSWVAALTRSSASCAASYRALRPSGPVQSSATTAVGWLYVPHDWNSYPSSCPENPSTVMFSLRCSAACSRYVSTLTPSFTRSSQEWRSRYRILHQFLAAKCDEKLAWEAVSK